MSMVMRPASWSLLVLGCSAAAVEPPGSPTPAMDPAAAAAPASLTALDSVAPAYRDCGELGCKVFPSAEAAFDFVLAENPRVLAVGEAHAQAAGVGLSATRRFMDGLLPRLSPRASDLVIELWVANGACGKVEQKVQKQQAEVTAPQAATNQNEFMELGHRAKALRIMPQALVPSCEQYQKIAGAGADDIAQMLTMLRDVTERDVRELLSKRPPDRLIVAYGGAMHNDVAPREGREDFSFGPALSEATSGRYVELDLIVPEQIKDTEAWRSLPWYPHYAQEKAMAGAYLFSWAPRGFALIFPKSGPAQAP
jgi:hypothetical protein